MQSERVEPTTLLCNACYDCWSKADLEDVAGYVTRSDALRLLLRCCVAADNNAIIPFLGRAAS